MFSGDRAVICVKFCLEVKEGTIGFGDIEAFDPDEQFLWGVEDKSLIGVNRER